jgi:hypothetical protein
VEHADLPIEERRFDRSAWREMGKANPASVHLDIQTNDHGLVLRHILSSLQSTSVIERRRVNAKRILPEERLHLALLNVKALHHHVGLSYRGERSVFYNRIPDVV